MFFTLLSIVSIILLVAILILLALFLLRGREKDYILESYSYIDPNDINIKSFDPPSKPANKFLSVIVPAYNEEKRISIMLDETIHFLQAREKKNPQKTWEIVIVDDGSKDGTVDLVLKNYVKVYGTDLIRLNKLVKNVGKGGAVRRGMLVGRGEYLLMVDADGATKFSDLEKVEKKILEIEKNGQGVVVGSRVQYHPEELSESERRPWFRNISHIVFAFFVDRLCVKGVKDTQCGFKLFTRKSAHELFLAMHIERWAFDVDLLYLSQSKNYPIGEVIVQWTEIDGSHLSVFSASLQMFKDVIRVPLLYRFGYWKSTI